MDGKGCMKNRLYYFKKMYYGRIKNTVRFSVIVFALLLYFWYN